MWIKLVFTPKGMGDEKEVESRLLIEVEKFSIATWEAE